MKCIAGKAVGSDAIRVALYCHARVCVEISKRRVLAAVTAEKFM